jgi:hypothetical protein
MKLEFSRQIIKKYLNIKFPVEAKLFHADGQTDGYDEANSRFSQFCQAPNNTSFSV